MTLATSTLRPGLLVSLKTHIAGNVRYQKQIIESDHEIEDGALKAKWETERVISDPEEHEAAKAVRGKARTLIAGVCAHSAFGLLCPESRADVLDAAIADARQLADDFNRRAKLSRVSVYVITGRIAPDDVEAVRAINSEVRDLLADMQQGIKNVDAKTVREACNKARSLGAMLSPEAADRIKTAIDAARSAARRIVKASEEAVQEIDQQTMRTIKRARTAFLDLDDQQDVRATRPTGRALDLSPEKPARGTSARARNIDL